jgi:hypothetical protein
MLPVPEKSTGHGCTATQTLVDTSVLGHDLRRGRAAAANIVPFTTGAAIAVTRPIPMLRRCAANAEAWPSTMTAFIEKSERARSQDLLNRVNFILRHGMSHPRVNPLIDLRIHSTEHFARFAHSFERDMGIGIAAPEEDGRAGERSWIVARRAGRSDEASAQREHACVSAGVTRREFQREARSLGKPEQSNSLRIDPLIVKRLDHFRKDSEP